MTRIPGQAEMRMHADQVDIDAALVGRLVAARFPEWVSLPIRPVAAFGTVNAVFRLGDQLSVRLPLNSGGESDLQRELRWLPTLAPKVPLTVPTPVEVGDATEGYPFTWAVYAWIGGRPYADGLVEEATAVDTLVAFVTELQNIPVSGGPPAGRAPLAELDESTRESIVAASSDVDASAALAVWEEALGVPGFVGTPVWIHTDLLRPNLLIAGERLRAVIDWGGAGVGDPAADVIAAWAVFGPVGRRRFREALRVDDATWQRARGFALHQALALIPYYRRSNPGMTELGLRTVAQILSDH